MSNGIITPGGSSPVQNSTAPMTTPKARVLRSAKGATVLDGGGVSQISNDHDPISRMMKTSDQSRMTACSIPAAVVSQRSRDSDGRLIAISHDRHKSSKWALVIRCLYPWVLPRCSTQEISGRGKVAGIRHSWLAGMRACRIDRSASIPARLDNYAGSRKV
jgi:hypothetical protein